MNHRKREACMRPNPWMRWLRFGVLLMWVSLLVQVLCLSCRSLPACREWCDFVVIVQTLHPFVVFGLGCMISTECEWRWAGGAFAAALGGFVVQMVFAGVWLSSLRG